MFEILREEEINTKRQYNLDVLKTIAVISMIMAHAVTALGRHRPGFENETLYLFGKYILSDYIAVAHAFMFAMGVGIVFSNNNDPKSLIERGVKTYIIGYVLNFFRYGIYNIFGSLFAGRLMDSFWNSLLEQDILQFAGLAMIATGCLKALKLDIKAVLFFSIILSAIGSCFSFLDTGNFLLNLFIGHFIATTDISCFVFFNWYIFVAFGMFFGLVIRRIHNLKAFYKKLLVISGTMSAAYILLTIKYGMFFWSKSNRYYSISTLDVIGLLSLDLLVLSVTYFFVDKIWKKLLKCCIVMSKTVNDIYIIHWIILGFIDSIFCFGLGIVMPYSLIYLIGIFMVVISYLIAAKRVKTL